ncbi:MAG: GNAT family N-acetyltransferase, partial [Chloroflexota bacterium]|nr:GNAT family N-acetyltransferase [Chloroflexota bacterium]
MTQPKIRAVRVRRAVVEDADAIERVRTDTWRAAYRGLMPDALLDGLGYDATRRREFMAALPPNQFVLVAEDEGAVAGFCIGGRSRAPEDRFRGEVYAIYVLPEQHGRGIGRAMLQAAARELVDRDLRSMIIWVLRENAPSRRFYERMGGVWIRDEVRDLDGVRVTESAYGWPDISRSFGG